MNVGLIMACGRKLTSQFNIRSLVCLFYGFEEKVILNPRFGGGGALNAPTFSAEV